MLGAFFFALPLGAQQPAVASSDGSDDSQPAASETDFGSDLDQPDLDYPPLPEPLPPAPLPAPQGAIRIAPRSPVWIDRKKGCVYVDGEISLRRGVLEMFACPRGTKEHESIVSVASPAFVVHGALLAVGAQPGKPVQWEPKFKPPTGVVIRIDVQWCKEGRYEEKPQTMEARQWVFDNQTGKPMEQDFVFAGSGFWKDEESGREYYLAEQGDMICVSNFGSAMIDVADHSPQANDGLLFEALTENIPPLGTPVRLVLTPQPKAVKPNPPKKFKF